MVPMSECAKLAHSDLKLNRKMELCAGNKIFRRIDAYRFSRKVFFYELSCVFTKEIIVDKAWPFSLLV